MKHRGETERQARIREDIEAGYTPGQARGREAAREAGYEPGATPGKGDSAVPRERPGPTGFDPSPRLKRSY